MKVKPYYQDDNVIIYNASCMDVVPFLAENSVDAIITDPPYSSGGTHKSSRTKSNSANKYCAKDRYVDFSGDSKDQRSHANWLTEIYSQCFKVLKETGYLLTFTDWRQLPLSTDIFYFANYIWRGVISWDKGASTRLPNTAYFRHQCEYVVWGTKGACKSSDYRRKSYDGSFKSIMKANDKEHPTQKPVELMKHLIDSVPEGSTVLDPFMGSGTTLIAGLESNRKVIGIEYSKYYCNVAVERIKKFYESNESIAA